MRKWRNEGLFGAGCAVLLLLAPGGCGAPAGDMDSPPSGGAAYGIPDSKERFETQRNAIAEKLQTALLPAMRNHGIDMWIVMDRENNEEPLHVELGGGFAGVRGAFIFHDNGSDTVEKLYYSSHEQPANSVISQIYDETIYYGYYPDGLTPHLRKAIEDRDPQTDRGQHLAHAARGGRADGGPPELPGGHHRPRIREAASSPPSYWSVISACSGRQRRDGVIYTRAPGVDRPLDGGGARCGEHHHRGHHRGGRQLVAARPGARAGAYRLGHRARSSGRGICFRSTIPTSRSSAATSSGLTAGSTTSTTRLTSSAPPTS